MLDLEDSVGILGKNKIGQEGRAHIGPCNGIAWTDDGAYMITCGHDERIRVWDAATGANTLVHFGPTVRNRVLAPVLPTVVPSVDTGLGAQVLLFPSEGDVLMFDLHDGALLKRLRGSTGSHAREVKAGKTTKERVTSIAWRASHCEFYSAHMGGEVRAWIPHPNHEASDGEDESAEVSDANGENDRKRKRLQLDQMHRDLTKQRITFT
jgi:DNA excision repair protein ERCC-8